MYQYIIGLTRTQPLSKSSHRITLLHRLTRKLRIFSFLAAALLALPFSLQAQPLRDVSFSYLPDPGLALTIESVSSPEKAGEFMPYVPSFMAFSRLPDTFNGAVWLRIAFTPSFTSQEGVKQIHFGASLPGTTRLFIPQPDGSVSVTSSAAPHGLFVLPNGDVLPDVVYARIDGAPGLWFRPVIEPAEETGNALPRRMILVGVLAFAMLVTLGQYIRKAEQWRLWAAIVAGCGIVVTFTPPFPAAGQAFVPMVAATLLMPGMILVFFSHMTRHLLETPKTMPGYDKMLAFYYILGGALALLPLVPEYLWTTRYLPFAGFALLPFLPLGMMAMVRSTRGAGALFCTALSVIVGVAASAWELTAPGTPYIDGAGGLWGLAFGMIFLSFTGPAKIREESRSEDDVFASLDRTCSLTTPLHETLDTATPFAEKTYAGLPPFADSAGTTPPQEQFQEPQPRPTLADAPGKAPDEDYPDLSLFGKNEENVPPQPAALAEPETPVTAEPEETATEQQEIFSTFLQEEPEPTPVAMPVAAPSGTPVEPSAVLVPEPSVSLDPPITLDDETDAMPVAVENFATAHILTEDLERKSLFDLPLTIKEIYDTIAPLAEGRNSGLTWFVVPQTGRLFEGEAELLKSALRLLLRDMVEAVDRGNIRLTVRRLPDSSEAGHLVFTIVGWDGKLPAAARNMAGLAEAWALAEKTGGIFSVEHSPTGGTTVIFSAVFTAMDKPKAVNETEDEPKKPDAPAETSAKVDIFANAEATGKEHISVFTDHPDIALPADIEPAVHSPLPAGLDGDELAEENIAERTSSQIIIVDTMSSGRSKTAAMFAETPYSVLECASPAAAVPLYARHPSSLLTMNADMPETDIVSAIKAIRAQDASEERSPAMLISFVEHEQQAERLLRGGSNVALLKPITKENLLDAVAALLPLKEEVMEETRNAPPPEREDLAPSTPEAVVRAALDIAPETAASEISPESSGIFAAALPAEKDTDAIEPTRSRLSSGPELALLDMIITDEKPESVPEEAPPVPTKAPASVEQEKKSPPSAKVKVVARPTVVTHNSQAKPAPPRQPEAKEESTPEKHAPLIAKPSASKTEHKIPVASAIPEASVADATPEVAKQETKPQVEQEIIRQKASAPKLDSAGNVKIDLSTALFEDPTADSKMSPLSNVLEKALQPDNGSGFRGVSRDTLPEATTSIPLPGEEDGVFKDMLPLVPGLIHELSDAMQDAAKGREEKSPMLVQEAAERIAAKAESFGLTKLERMAKCVERAAAADDIEPMECVLADLESWVARYKEALQKLHREMHW